MTRDEPLQPMQVRWIKSGRSAGPEPSLDQSWSDEDKLRWHAGVLLAKTGVRVTFTLDALWRKDWRGRHRPVPGHYGVNVGNSSHVAYTFDEAWTFLNGIETGIEAARGDLGAVAA